LHGAAQHRLVDQQRVEARPVPPRDALVGVDVEDPVARRRIERRIARGGEVAGPRVLDDARAGRLRDLARVVDRAGVGDDDLVDARGERRKTAFEVPRLVADDQRGGDPAGQDSSLS